MDRRVRLEGTNPHLFVKCIPTAQQNFLLFYNEFIRQAHERKSAEVQVGIRFASDRVVAQRTAEVKPVVAGEQMLDPVLTPHKHQVATSPRHDHRTEPPNLTRSLCT